MRCSRKTHAIDVTHVVLAAGRSREDFPSLSALAFQGLAVVFSGACMPGAEARPIRDGGSLESIDPTKHEDAYE
jgi:hypothetical protein